MKVHALASVFPMMPAPVLQELADDIKQNGLREPIAVLGDTLIDGRNRLAACKLAGIKPTTRALPADVNPIAYIISANVHRRHMTKGSQAMAVALAYPDPARTGGRPDRGKQAPVAGACVAHQKISDARLVIRVFGADSDVVRQVMAGGSLQDAHTEAKAIQQEQELEKTRLLTLRREFPELAARIDSKELTLNQAEQLANAERQVKQQHQELSRLQERVLKLREETGQPIQIRLPPRLIQVVPPEASDAVNMDSLSKKVGGMASGMQRAMDEIEVLGDLLHIKDKLKEIVAKPAFRGADQNQLVVGVHANVSHIVQLAYELAELYSKTLGIKAVK